MVEAKVLCLWSASSVQGSVGLYVYLRSCDMRGASLLSNAEACAHNLGDATRRNGK